MKIDILGGKVLCADEVFNADEFAKIESEIQSLQPHIKPTFHESDVTLYRVPLDSHYPDRKLSYILQAIQTRLYDERIIAKASSVHDLAYTLLNKQHKFRSFLTEMRDDTDYRTHTDTGDTHDWTQIFMSWIWYYNPRPEAFSGGELDVVDLDVTVQPKNNRLVLLPAYLRHRIRKASFHQDNYYRTTLNGFLTYSEAASASATSMEIERALAQGLRVGSLMLPEPAGKLGAVRQALAMTMGRLEQAGHDLGSSPNTLATGDKAFRQQRFVEAYDCYCSAYAQAVAGKPD